MTLTKRVSAKALFVGCGALVSSSCSPGLSLSETQAVNPVTRPVPSAAPAPSTGVVTGQCPALPPGASAAADAFLNELVSHFGKLQFQGSVRVDSESKAFLGVSGYNLQATTPLIKAATLNLTSVAGGTPTGVVAGNPDLLVQFSLSKENKPDALAQGKIRFSQLKMVEGKVTQVPTPLKIDLISQNASRLSWTLNSIDFSGQKVNVPGSEIRINGSCELLQETVHFSLDRSGKIKAITGQDKSKCLFVMKYDSKCNKFSYQFDYASPQNVGAL